MQGRASNCIGQVAYKSICKTVIDIFAKVRLIPSNADVRKVKFNLVSNKELLKTYEPVSGMIREVLQEDTSSSNG